MPNSDSIATVDALSARIMALEMLLFALVDTCPDRAALRSAFDTYATGIEAKMNALPVADRQLDLLRVSLDDMWAVIDQRTRECQSVSWNKPLLNSEWVICRHVEHSHEVPG